MICYVIKPSGKHVFRETTFLSKPKKLWARLQTKHFKNTETFAHVFYLPQIQENRGYTANSVKTNVDSINTNAWTIHALFLFLFMLL